MIIIIKMSDKEIYQSLSKKRPHKNYRGGFGDYFCIRIRDVKVPFMMQIE